MNVEMTGQAIREHFQLPFVMRFSMAFQTAWDLAVLLVTHDTHNLAMFAWSALPFAINIFVTATTGLNFGIARKTDSQRCMNPHMTGHTVLHRLLGIMTIVTLRAVRNIAMFLVVTTLAVLLCVGARELF